MKYIRTKNGIYEVDIEIGVDCDAPYYRVFGVDYDIPFEEIINQADTIEELCDEFVYVASEKDRPVICYKPSAFHKLSDNLYGAIWTERGLIYVAKMNDKGDLELL